MTRLFITLQLPWDALCLARALPEARVATFGGPRIRRAFADAGLAEPLLVPADAELMTSRLLADDSVGAAIAAEPSRLICFKPMARLERRAAELGASLALAPAAVAQAIENKIALPGIAEAAGVLIPPTMKASAQTSWDELTAALGPDLVVQLARSFAGRGTWPVTSADELDALRPTIGRKPLRVTRRIDGLPGTAGAIVDAAGRVRATAAMVQVTGDRRLTGSELGACGVDFTWRVGPDPSDAVHAVATALGPVLADRGYRGHFGLDFVFDGDELLLIEVNARLTASFGLYSTLQPALLEAHLTALRDEPIEPGRLPPLEAGQLIRLHTGPDPVAPPSGPGLQPSPKALAQHGDRLARLPVDGVVVDEEGQLGVRPLHLT